MSRIMSLLMALYYACHGLPLYAENLSQRSVCETLIAKHHYLAVPFCLFLVLWALHSQAPSFGIQQVDNGDSRQLKLAG